MTSSAAPPRSCPACGAANPLYATFCHECGEPLAAPTTGAGAGAPAADRGRGPRWELWLGLALVVGVLGVALLDWGQRETQARQYRQGEQAVAVRHWDAARAAFGGLGGYRDAAKRRDEAAAQAQARDRAYQAGLAAVMLNDPIAAYQAFSQTLAIEPDYRDAPVRFAVARQELPHAILAETVYRRVSDGPPGLYLARSTGGDLRLPGSDERSTMRSSGPADGPLVYDGPIPGVTPVPFPVAPDSNFYNVGQLTADRQLLLVDSAALRAGTPVTPTVLPAALGTGGFLLANDQVVWSPAGYTAPPRFGLGYVQGSVVDQAYYYDLTTGQGGNLTYPGTEGYVTLDLGQAGSQQHWVLGDYRAARRAPYQTTLTLLGDSGARPQPVVQVAGIVFEAHLSADGNYLLYKMSTGDTGQPDLRLNLVLVDLRDPAYPARTIESLPLGPSDTLGSLQAQFVPGSGAPRILIRRLLTAAGQHQTQLDLWSLSEGTARRLWETPRALPYSAQGLRAEIYWLAPDGQSVTITVPDGRGNADLFWQPLDPTRPAVRLGLPGGEADWWQPIFPGTVPPSDYLFYYLVQRSSEANGAETLVYGVAAQDPARPPALLFTLSPGGDFPTSLTLLPSGLFALQGGGAAVQVRTPDGAVRLPALPGIDQIMPRPDSPLYPTALFPRNY